MGQDQDWNRANEAMLAGLFPNYPMGRPIIGLPEHIKNPSMVNIMNFYHKYYVPNNMAIIMSGDFDMDKTIKMIDRTFGQMPAREFQNPELPVEKPIDHIITREIYGPEAEFVNFAFRFGGAHTMDKKYVMLIDNMLSNAAAGLIDLNLVQQQKILNGGSYNVSFRDYGIHEFWGHPKEGQSLEEVRDLLLGELDKIKKGDFENWLIPAVINDLRLQTTRNRDNYRNRAYSIFIDFMNETKYIETVKLLDDLEDITKDDLVKFANEHYKDNYVIVYKRHGTARNIVKVPKPPITPVDINRTDQSKWYTDFVREKPEPIKPVYIDFNTAMQRKEIKPGIDFFYIPNKSNDLFDLIYVIDMGNAHDKKLTLAVSYLPYVGTDQYSPAQIQQEFFKLGLRFNVFTGDIRSYIMLSGLNKSLEKGTDLLEHLLTHAKGDTVTYNQCIDKIIKERANNKLDHDYILHIAMSNYGRYGKNSLFTNILQEEEMRGINPNELTGYLKDLCTYKHKIVYYGKSDLNSALDIISKSHPAPETVKDYPEPVRFPEADFNTDHIFFINYDMVQANMRFLEKIAPFDAGLLPPV
jgi:predicted Zn-dependent peptidase